jgi:hypothetical protein
MSDTKLGQYPGDDQLHRDAIHVAVAPVIAGQILSPGEHVGFMGDETDGLQHVGRVFDRIGIIDPFLTEPVMPGQRVYLCLYQQTITSLRHNWTHPAFEGAERKRKAQLVVDAMSGKREAEQWIRWYASEVYQSYEDIMAAAIECARSGGWSGSSITLDFDTPDIVYNKRLEFWKNFETLTGLEPADKEATFIGCAC